MFDTKLAKKGRSPFQALASAAAFVLAMILVAAGADGYRAVKALTEIRVLMFGSN